MNPRKPQPPLDPIMKQLSPDEQKVLLMAQRHRAEYWRRLKRVKAFGKNMKHTLLLTTCALGLLAANAPAAQANEAAGVSAPALFNEANAELRAGRLGSAILGYERAQWLAPGDQAITQNLSAAREKAGVAAPVVPMWQRPAQWLSFNSLAALASICLLLFSLLLFGTRWIPITLRGFARGAAASLSVVAILAVSAVAVRWPELNQAVIVGARSIAHIAPAENAAPSFELKAGERVRAEKSHGQFVLVRTATGQSGWVSGAEVEKIFPSAS